MTTLIESYALEYKDEIVAVVYAVNSRGISIVSEANQVRPTTQDVPRRMQSCVQQSETTNNVVALEWSEPDNGGSQITGYIVASKFVEELDFVQLVTNYQERQL